MIACTAGTTGTLLVPHDPRAAACYAPMLELRCGTGLNRF